jgi:hypothetical protein
MSPRDFLGRNLEEVLPAEAAAVATSALHQAHAFGLFVGPAVRADAGRGAALV